jgi:hypothetical protein
MEEQMLTASFIISAEQKAALEDWAKAEDRSVSSLLRVLIDGALRLRAEAQRPVAPLNFQAMAAEG